MLGRRSTSAGLGVAVAGLLAGLVGGSSPPAPAAQVAAVPARCAAGHVALTVAGKRRCVPAKGFLPAASPTMSVGTFLARGLLDGSLLHPVLEALPPPGNVPPARPSPADILATRASGQIESFAKEVLARIPAKSVRRPASATGAASSSGSEPVSLGNQAGWGGILKVNAAVPDGDDGQPDKAAAAWAVKFTAGMKGPSASLGIRMVMSNGFKWDGPCPSSQGKIGGKEPVDVTLTNTSAPGGGIEYLRTATTVRASGSATGTVSPDASLDTIAFSQTLTVRVAHGLRALHGPMTQSRNIVETARFAGTIDGASGNVTFSSFDVAARVPGELASWKKIAAEWEHSTWRRFKQAETKWREPNHCARIVFYPKADDSLASGATETIQGRVVAKTGGPSDAIWGRPTVSNGTVGGLPGVTTAGAPITVTATGGTPSGPQGRTVEFEVRASSRAGVATQSWVGRT